MSSLLWDLCCGICVVESSLLNSCFGDFEVVVADFFCGIFVAGSLLWNLRC